MFYRAKHWFYNRDNNAMNRTPNEERAWKMLETSVGPYIWKTSEIAGFTTLFFLLGFLGGFMVGTGF